MTARFLPTVKFFSSANNISLTPVKIIWQYVVEKITFVVVSEVLSVGEPHHISKGSSTPQKML